MSQITKALSELGCSSRSNISNGAIIPAILINNKFELDQHTFQN